MSLLTAAQAALDQLEHLHGPGQCLHPETCATAATIKALRDAINEPKIFEGRHPKNYFAASEEAEKIRFAWEQGFTLARHYGDNAHHFDGEQKERHWQSLVTTMAFNARLKDSLATYPPMKVEEIDTDTAHAILRAKAGIGAQLPPAANERKP